MKGRKRLELKLAVVVEQKVRDGALIWGVPLGAGERPAPVDLEPVAELRLAGRLRSGDSDRISSALETRAFTVVSRLVSVCSEKMPAVWLFASPRIASSVFQSDL